MAQVLYLFSFKEMLNGEGQQLREETARLLGFAFQGLRSGKRDLTRLVRHVDFFNLERSVVY